MATGEGQGEASGHKRRQDPYVERLRPDPGEPPPPVIVLDGLLGESDRPGHRRLYLSPELDYYAEFHEDAVIDIAPIPADQAPFFGLESTRVTLRRDSTIDYTRSQTGRPLDEFDLDLRVGPAGPQPELRVATPNTCFDPCDFETRPRTICETCRTCQTCGATCRTCNTCAATCQTCATQCNTCGGTCQTCATQCGTCVTCDTCRTDCGGRTCDFRFTCDFRCEPTFNRHVPTCFTPCP
jgi:hypothetical protein